MRIRNFRLSTLFVLLALLSCSNEDMHKGSGNLISENRNVAGFTKIQNSTSINLVIVQGSAQQIEVTADDNIINDVKTDVENEVLKVDLSKGNYVDVTITLSITTTKITELQNTGSGNMTVTGFEDTPRLKIDNEGSGNIVLSGSGDTLLLENSGSGSYKGFGFAVSNCTVNNSGSGDCEINCNVSLGGTNSGSGSIFYKGSPTVAISNSGSGQVIDSN